MGVRGRKGADFTLSKNRDHAFDKSAGFRSERKAERRSRSRRSTWEREEGGLKKKDTSPRPSSPPPPSLVHSVHLLGG